MASQEVSHFNFIIEATYVYFSAIVHALCCIRFTLMSHLCKVEDALPTHL